VFGLHHVDVGSVLKSALLVLLVVVGVMLMSACADGLGLSCEHACCMSADRARSLRRLVRRLAGGLRLAVGALSDSLEGAAEGAMGMRPRLSFAQPILPEASPLRI